MERCNVLEVDAENKEEIFGMSKNCFLVENLK